MHSTGLRTSNSTKILERVKDSRLKGSDVYVARLGWRKTKEALLGLPSIKIEAASASPGKEASIVNPPEEPKVRPPMGSLHDEISDLGEVQSTNEIANESTEHDSICQSRPCYRCTSYMYSVGIKRAFWTNGHGGWESAKIGDLVNNIQIPASNTGNESFSDPVTTRNRLYIT